MVRGVDIIMRGYDPCYRLGEEEGEESDGSFSTSSDEGNSAPLSSGVHTQPQVYLLSECALLVRMYYECINNIVCTCGLAHSYLSYPKRNKHFRHYCQHFLDTIASTGC